MPVESFVIVLLTVAAIAAAEPVAAEEPPDIELLEFLGGWETSSGKWLDPTSLVDDVSTPTQPQSEGKHE